MRLGDCTAGDIVRTRAGRMLVLTKIALGRGPFEYHAYNIDTKTAEWYMADCKVGIIGRVTPAYAASIGLTLPPRNPEEFGKRYPGWNAVEYSRLLAISTYDSRKNYSWHWTEHEYTAPTCAQVPTRDAAYDAAEKYVMEREQPKPTCAVCGKPLVPAVPDATRCGDCVEGEHFVRSHEAALLRWREAVQHCLDSEGK